MKIIDLLNKIANGEETPKKIKIKNWDYKFELNDDGYFDKNDENLTDYIYSNEEDLNREVEIIVEEDKDIPLMPDDELFIVNDKLLDYNFKVLHEKINQVVKEFNVYRRENDK